MESGKQVNSETSIDENDHPEKVNIGDKIGAGRSYDCTFCKRGFTNAQALGGHMNIHRKDKAKVKQMTPSSVSNKSNEGYTTFKKFGQISDEQEHYYAPLGVEMNYQTHFPAPNPNFVHAYHQNNLADPRSRDFGLHEEGLGSNLSLRIGPPYMEDSKEMENSGKGGRNIENEMDLELRLGYDP